MRKLFLISSIIFGGLLFAQNDTWKKYTVKSVENEFTYKNYSPIILKKMAKEFNKLTGDPREINIEINIGELIPGEIVYWSSSLMGKFWDQSFLIKGNELREISTIPDENFLKKINQYAGSNKYFEFENKMWNDSVYLPNSVKKTAEGKYIVNQTVYLYKNGEDYSYAYEKQCDEYEVEYETQDFKTFAPLKIRKLNDEDLENANWIMLK